MPDFKNSEYIAAFTKYLGCPCTPLQVSSMAELTTIYKKALQEGQEQGFVPVIIEPSDTLWESCKFNTAPDDIHSEFLDISAADISEYRKQQLERLLEEGYDILKGYLDERVAEYIEEYHQEIPLGAMDTDESCVPLNEFLLGGDKLPPLLLAKLPITDPWEVFAFVPFGNWNDCPDTPTLMAVSKYWYEKYKAMPAFISSDVVNYYVPEPVAKEQAMQLATEHFSLCADIVEQGTETIGALADSLWQSTFWFFWWD